MNKLLILFEKVFTVISFIHYSGAPLVVILSDGISEGQFQDENPDFPIINNLFMVIYSITFCLLILRWKKVVVVILESKFILLLLGLAICSISWSYLPELTRTRAIALTGTMMFSLYLASRFSLKEQLQLLGWVFGIAVVTSILFVVLIPKYGVMAGIHAGAIRGIYNHKNVLGKYMVSSAVVFILLALTAQKQRWIYWSLCGASVALVLLSRSSSSLINLIIVLGIFFVLQIVRWNYILLVPALMGLLSVGIMVSSLLASRAEEVAGIFGKNLTLTGRTNFWPLVLDKIWEKPWFGYGFGAFWRGLDGPSAYIWNASTFKTPNGHNGYLDLCLELGLVGCLIYAIAFVIGFQKSLVYIRLVRTPEAFWPTILFCYMVLTNLTESSLVVQNNFFWTMQAAAFFSLSVLHLNSRTNPDLKIYKH